MHEDNFESVGLRTLEDISSLILHSHDLRETLQNIVNLVAKRIGTDVCSIYLLEKDGETLTLYATKGLSRSAVGKVRMNTSEGLTGLVVERKGVVAIEDAPSHPRYKYFRETREERFHSFLGLPLFEHKSPTGVIIVQTREPRSFSPGEISALTTISNQISSIVINARLLDSIRVKEEERDFFQRELLRMKSGEATPYPARKEKGPRMMRGIAASPGFSIGGVSVLERSASTPSLSPKQAGSRQEEKKLFFLAVEKAKIQTLYLEKRVARTLSKEDAAIFHTHLMILEDRGFTAKVQELIDQDFGAVRAVEDVVESYVDAFYRMDDPYLRERSADMKDIGRRIIDCLLGNERPALELRDKRIIVAKEILPSDLAILDHEKILGIVSGSGDINSHAFIMAKSLGIPAVIAPWENLRTVSRKDEIIVDGNTGCVYINPDSKVKGEYERLQADFSRKQRELSEIRDLPALTTDGTSVVLLANIALLNDIKVALANGAEGVGLYRTEFPYMARDSFPDRNDLARVYRKILEGFSPLPVTIRTLDIGGDKNLPYFPHPEEENPFMGWRSIRLSLEKEEILREQLAGILMASTYGCVRLLFPLVSSLEEVEQLKKILADTKQEVIKAGNPVADELQFGIMIEVPAAVQIADFLIREVDFFSIGTNDLIQYTLAADRNNSKIKQYYDPYHPAVLHYISQVADSAARAGKRASLCGEMASNPLNSILLLGLGITELSISAPAIPAVKKALRSISRKEAKIFADSILNLGSSVEIRRQMEIFGNSHGLSVTARQS